MSGIHATFVWNELNTKDAAGSVAFYGSVLGWTFEETPIAEGIYRVAKLGDRRVAGIFELSGPRFDGIPTHWLAYIAVDDIDARVAAAVEAGARIIREPWDVAGVGRIAILMDPQGGAQGWITPTTEA